MATATHTTLTVRVPVTTYKEEQKVTGVTLNLTLEEAQMLRQVISDSHVAHDVPWINGIRTALTATGIVYKYQHEPRLTGGIKLVQN